MDSDEGRNRFGVDEWRGGDLKPSRKEVKPRNWSTCDEKALEAHPPPCCCSAKGGPPNHREAPTLFTHIHVTVHICRAVNDTITAILDPVASGTG